MSGMLMFDRQMLDVAFSEIDAVRRALPQATLTALAEEVVTRVAQNLNSTVVVETAPSRAEIEGLTRDLLSSDHSAAAAFIDSVRRQGASYESLCIAYLGAAAHQLGEWWNEDKVSFYQVTIAAGRIYAILRILRMERAFPAPDLRQAAIFASVPGENHTLGITMAADMARSRGWDIELCVGMDHEELVRALDARQPALIGLSASTKRSLPALTRLIVALRILNPGVQILVCGNIVASTISLVGVTGADAAALDFETAISEMGRLLGKGVGMN